MLGYNLIGYSAIGELDRHQAQILVPTLTISLSIAAPKVATGASVSPPTVILSNVDDAPAIRGGAQIAVPEAEVDLVPQVPGISISANIYPPMTSTSYVPQVPSVYVGAQVQATFDVMALSIFEPFITAGKSVFPPAAQITFEPQVPGISISSNNLIPVKTLTFKPFAPGKVGGGVLIEVGIVQVQYDLGGIGDTLIGEFAIGEGRVVTKTVNRILLLNMQPFEPQVMAGAQVLLPNAFTLGITLKTAEIDSRRRKLRAQVILS